MRDIIYHKQFKRDMERVKAAGRGFPDELIDITAMLQADAPLPAKHQNHPLKGDWAPAWDCHVRPDLLLIYEKTGNELHLLRLASHAELF